MPVNPNYRLTIEARAQALIESEPDDKARKKQRAAWRNPRR
jgi:hypothetical protein